MAITLESVLLRSPDPERSAEFWGGMTGRSFSSDSRSVLIAGTPTQVGLRFELGAVHTRDAERLHLHLSQTENTQRDRIDACIAAGATLLGSGNIPANSYARMADPVGEEYCVIEDDNRYLAGCGPLGEVTCTGTRAVGLFWGKALGWPVVWDEGEEIAIQSPQGGTKLAWDGAAPTQAQKDSGQRFVVDLGSARFDDEVSRLVSLGATVDDATLRDPDGVEFAVRSAP